jgi:hypothetical protein
MPSVRKTNGIYCYVLKPRENPLTPEPCCANGLVFRGAYPGSLPLLHFRRWYAIYNLRRCKRRFLHSLFSPIRILRKSVRPSARSVRQLIHIPTNSLSQGTGITTSRVTPSSLPHSAQGSLIVSDPSLLVAFCAIPTCLSAWHL